MTIYVTKSSNDKFQLSLPQVVELDVAMLGTISKFNGNMTVAEVEAALLAGRPVHTNFSVYKLHHID